MPIPDNTERLSRLRPVRFHLKTEPAGAIQYGLIAEEVERVYPELVIHDLEGRIQGVRYDELAPMLLHEVQKQQQLNAVQAEQSRLQAAEISELQSQLAEIRAALLQRPAAGERDAQR